MLTYKYTHSLNIKQDFIDILISQYRDSKTTYCQRRPPLPIRQNPIHLVISIVRLLIFLSS